MSSRSLLVAVGGLLLGVFLGVVGAFWVPLRLGGVRVPLSPLLVPVAVVVACRVAGLWTRSGLAAAAPGLGWAAAVLVLSMQGPGGDIVLQGDDPVATAYLLVGMAGAAVGGVVGVPRPTRPPSRDAPPPARQGRFGPARPGRGADTPVRH